MEAKQDLPLRRLTDIDEDGYFEDASYYAVPGQNFMNEETTHYKLNMQKIKVPKRVAAQIQARIDAKVKAEQDQLQREDIFQKDIYMMPSEQRSTYLRNTQRACTICGGPHQASQCPLKTQQRMLFERPLNKTQKVTYACIMEPLPLGWERWDINSFVIESFGKVFDEILALNVQQKEIIEQLKDPNLAPRDRSLLEFRKDQIAKQIEEKGEIRNHGKPSMIKVNTDRNNSTQRFAYIHFDHKDAAETFARIREKTKVQGEQFFMNVVYRGEWKPKLK